LGKIEQKKEYIFDFPLRVSQDYLSTYSSNANFIGQIEKPRELRQKIIKGYMLLQRLMKAYEKNNMLLEEHAKVIAIGNYGAGDVFYYRLLQYAPELKKEHDYIEEFMKDLLKALEKELPQLDTERFWEQ